MFSHILPLVLKWATDEISCLGENAITKWGGPLWVLQVLNMDSLLVMKLPWAASKFKGNFLFKLFLLKSCWSDAVGPQHLCRCAKPSGFWPQNGPGCVAATYVDVYQRLIFSYFHLATMTLVLGFFILLHFLEKHISASCVAASTVDPPPWAKHCELPDESSIICEKARLHGISTST